MHRIVSLLTLVTFGAGQIIHNQLPIGSSFGVPGPAVYDYVIVGGGTTGLTVATRLAQDGRFSVAVLEAGGFANIDNGNRSSIPGFAFSSLGQGGSLAGVNPKIDWLFRWNLGAHLKNRFVHYVRGKCLGGSSVRNQLLYQRPSKGSLDKWAADVGDETWSWENVLPLYKKSTTLNPPNAEARAANVSTAYDTSYFAGGPVQVGYPNYVSGLATWAFKAFDDVGSLIGTTSLSNGTLLGHQFTPLSIDASQERSTAQTAYLDLALKTTQLTVYTGALAKKILFDGNKTANGVLVETEGVLYTLSAKREVILSAGAVQSPQILMVSGIGPAETLQKFNISVVADRPGVGRELHDNPYFALSYAVPFDTQMTILFNPAKIAQAAEEYNTRRTGFLTSTADVINFEKAQRLPGFEALPNKAKADLATFPQDWPDLQFIPPGILFGSMPTDARNYGSFLCGLIAPLSRGTVTINSTDTADPPIVDPNWLSHPSDRALALFAFRRMRAFLATPSMQSIVLPPGEVHPGANVTSDEDIWDFISGQAESFYHAAGTCKMGRRDDVNAVVDSKAKVIGVQGLRVVDMSAVPFLPPGQPQATCYMIGEKIAEEILREAEEGKGYGG